ncbi:hypothetical protein ABPG74_004474 [Tetrahymena malaccensis]
MNKIGSSLIFALVVLNVATSQVIKIPIEKRIPETESNGSFLDDEEQVAVAQLINHDQYMYSGNIEVGNSKQTYTVDFDSGSNLLWLTSKNCPSCVKDGYKHSYDCTPQDGCTLTTTPAQVTYGDGSGVKGHIAKVPVSIAGIAPVTEALLLVEQSIRNGNLQVNYSNFNYQYIHNIALFINYFNQKADGLMGLGVYDENNTGNVAFVNQLFKQGLITKSQFSFYLGFGKTESELTIGGIDESKLANPSEIYYHPIVLNGRTDDSQRWRVAFKSISFGSQSIPTTSQNTGIVDSGTSLAYIRSDIYKQWINYLKTIATLKPIYQGLSVFYSVKCGTTLPDLTFTLTDVNGVDRNYSLPSSFYILNENGTCIIGIQGNSVTGDLQFLLGDVFMRRFVSVFDYTNLSMGLSVSVANPATTAVTKNHKNGHLALLAIGLVALSGLIFLTLRALRK